MVDGRNGKLPSLRGVTISVSFAPNPGSRTATKDQVCREKIRLVLGPFGQALRRFRGFNRALDEIADMLQDQERSIAQIRMATGASPNAIRRAAAASPYPLRSLLNAAAAGEVEIIECEPWVVTRDPVPSLSVAVLRSTLSDGEEDESS